MEKSLKPNWFFLLENPLQKYSTKSIFLFTIYHMIYRHTSNKVHHMWQLLISFKWKLNLLYFKINLLFHTPISDFKMTSDSNTNCITMETIEQEIADEYLDNLMLNTINTIRKNRKRPHTSSIHEYLQKSWTILTSLQK